MNIRNLLFLFLFSSAIHAQIITVDPIFPTVNDMVTITYDATKGNAGLIGVETVYMHTGVITDQSTNDKDWKFVVSEWGVDDPKVKMTNIGNDMHQISYVIKDYYEFPEGTIVEEMAFVFRNVDGTREGKTEDFGDIFSPVYSEDSGFLSTIISPAEDNLILDQGDTIQVKIATSINSEIKLFEDDIEIISINGRMLEYDIIATTVGDHSVRYEATASGETLVDSFNYLVKPEVKIEELPDGSITGIQVLDSQSVRLNLFAPNKEFVFVIGDFNDWKPDTTYFLKNSSNGNNWWTDIKGLDPNMEYGFQYVVDGNITIGDPYSEKVLNAFDDQFISESTYPDLKPYPVGQTNGFVTVFKINRDPFEWTDQDFIKPDKEELIIYELLLRDFLEENNFQTLFDTLPYLEKLGINAIQLMPVNEFLGNISWGYSPEYHMALDKYYGTPEALKAFINSAHERGIAVLLDVVYNHATGGHPFAALYWDRAINRTAPDNPWFNVFDKHPFGVFHDFNHQYEGTREYVKRTLQYWLEEFHIDGFRFDLSKGFTQRTTTDDSQFRKFDPDRINFLKEYADHIWSVNPDAYVTLEHFAENAEEKVLSDYGMMLWANQVHSKYSEATMGFTENGKSDLSDIAHTTRGWSDKHLIGYMESHDEERLMYKNKTFGNSIGDYSTRDPITRLERLQLAAAFFYTIPGPKLMWQFGELGYDFSINQCLGGGINSSCRTEPKPIRWDFLSDPKRKETLDVFRAIIQLRTKYPTFNTEDFQLEVRDELKRIHLNHPEMNATIIGNFGMVSFEINPNFQHTGSWYDYLTGEEWIVSDVNDPIKLEAGSFYIFTDEQIDTPEISTSIKDLVIGDQIGVLVYPNPVSDQFTVALESTESGEISIQLKDMNGRQIWIIRDFLYPGENEFVLQLDQNIVTGLYYLDIKSGNEKVTKKIMINQRN